MDNNDKSVLVYRIINGFYKEKIGNEVLTFKSPSKETIYESEVIYNECYNDSMMLGAFTDEEVYDYLITQGKWTEEEEKLLTDTLPENLKKFKKGLYQSFFRNSGLDKNSIKRSIEVTREEISRLQSIRYSLGEITCNGLAFMAKNLYLTEKTTYKGKKRYKFNKVSMKDIFDKRFQKTIKESDYRELARCPVWFTIWTTHKQIGNLFDGFLTEEQQNLVEWAIRFDNIYQNPECPPDEILDDHDALDGWFMLRSEEQEQKTLKQEIEASLNPRIRNCSEVYIPAKEGRAIDEIQGFSLSEINSLNDEQAEAIKQSKIRQANAKGRLREQDSVEGQRDLRMQAVNQARNLVKGRR